MPYTAGNFSLYTPGNPAVTATTISSSTYNSTLSDIATGLSTCVLKDGTQVITANLPMNSKKFTGLAAGSTSGDSVRYEQVLLLAGGTMTGNLLFTDNTLDIGASGATRPRTLYVGTSIVVPTIGSVSTQQHSLPAVASDTIALLAATQTLAAKTLTSPVINTGISGTAIASASDVATATSNTLIVTPLALASTKTVTYIGNTNDDTDLTTYTFAAHSIGTAAYNRCVHVAIHGNGGANLVTSVTVAGITAEINANALNGSSCAAIASAFVASGTTADIVVTFAGGQLGCRIGVWSSVGLIHTSAISATSTADPATATLTTTANGFCIAATSKNSADTMTWAGGVTERYDATSGENRMGSGADGATTAAGITPTGDYATGAGIGVFATF